MPITSRMRASLANDNRRERRATRQLRIRALGATGRVAEAVSYQLELEAHGMHRPARTFVLPVPLSRMLAAYTPVKNPGANIDTGIIIPVTNAIEALNSKIRRTVRTRGHFPSDTPRQN